MPPVAGHQFLLFPPARPLAERFGREFFRTVPEAPGVYLMSTARDGVLYVGKAKNLRRRLGNHRSGTGERLPPRLVRLLLRVERIDWDVCPDEAAAIARERELIRLLQPRFNCAGVRPPKDWFIGWRHDPRAQTLTLSLRPGPAPEPGVWPEARGPLRHAPPVFAALVRSLWITLNPGRSIAACPAPLLGRPALRSWTVPWSAATAAWLDLLIPFLDGQPSPWAPAVAPPAPAEPASAAPASTAPEGSAEPPAAPLTFDQQWHALDRECLTEFHQRRQAARLAGEGRP